MPFRFPNGSEYKLLLLDTNVLSNIAKNRNGELEILLSRFLLNKYAPCFSFQSILELRKSSLNGKTDLYQKFNEIFSVIPCLTILPYRTITNQEINKHIHPAADIDLNLALHAFSPFGKDDSYDFDKFIGTLLSKLIHTVNAEENEVEKTVASWVNERLFYQKRHQKLLYNTFETKFFKEFLMIEKPELSDSKLNPNDFPAIKMMCITKFNRVHVSKKSIGVNDVYDVLISAAIPYMDAIVTEKHQVEVLKQNEQKLKALQKIEKYTLSSWGNNNKA